jgi:hypothetical protein
MSRRRGRRGARWRSDRSRCPSTAIARNRTATAAQPHLRPPAVRVRPRRERAIERQRTRKSYALSALTLAYRVQMLIKIDEPVREIARSYNVSHSTISRLAPQILCPRLPSNRTDGEIFSPRQIDREIKLNPAPPMFFLWKRSEHFIATLPGFAEWTLCVFWREEGRRWKHKI